MDANYGDFFYTEYWGQKQLDNFLCRNMYYLAVGFMAEQVVIRITILLG